MRPSLGGVDIVGERQNTGGNVIDILKRNLYGFNSLHFLFNVKNIFVERFLEFVIKSDERKQTSFEIKSLRRNFKRELAEIKDICKVNVLFERPRVNDRNPETLDEVRLLAHVTYNTAEIILNDWKNFRISLECHNSPVRFRSANFFDAGFGFALFVFLIVDATIAMHHHFAEDGKGVYNRSADPVKTAGDFVAFAAELAASVKRGHNGFKRRNFGLLVNINRNTTAVVRNPHSVTRQKYDFNIIAKTTHRFVARVVENFGNEVV